MARFYGIDGTDAGFDLYLLDTDAVVDGVLSVPGSAKLHSFTGNTAEGDSYEQFWSFAFDGDDSLYCNVRAGGGLSFYKIKVTAPFTVTRLVDSWRIPGSSPATYDFSADFNEGNYYFVERVAIGDVYQLFSLDVSDSSATPQAVSGARYTTARRSNADAIQGVVFLDGVRYFLTGSYRTGNLRVKMSPGSGGDTIITLDDTTFAFGKSVSSARIGANLHFVTGLFSGDRSIYRISDDLSSAALVASLPEDMPDLRLSNMTTGPGEELQVDADPLPWNFDLPTGGVIGLQPDAVGFSFDTPEVGIEVNFIPAWSAEMTIGRSPNGSRARGYASSNIAPAAFSQDDTEPFGALSNNQLTLGGVNYTVEALYIATSAMRMFLNRDFPTLEGDAQYTLVIDGIAVPSSQGASATTEWNFPTAGGSRVVLSVDPSDQLSSEDYTAFEAATTVGSKVSVLFGHPPIQGQNRLHATPTTFSFDLPTPSLDHGTGPTAHELTPGKIGFSFDLPKVDLEQYHHFAPAKVSWSFDLPAPSVDIDQLHELNAEKVGFSFDLPSAVAQRYHHVDAGSVGFAFDLPSATAERYHHVDAGEVQYVFDLPSTELGHYHHVDAGAVAFSFDSPEASAEKLLFTRIWSGNMMVGDGPSTLGYQNVRGFARYGTLDNDQVYVFGETRRLVALRDSAIFGVTVSFDGTELPTIDNDYQDMRLRVGSQSYQSTRLERGGAGNSPVRVDFSGPAFPSFPASGQTTTASLHQLRAVEELTVGSVSWEFDLPSPVVEPYHHLDARSVTFAFNLPIPSVDFDEIHELTVGGVSWAFDLPQSELVHYHDLAVAAVDFSFDLPSPIVEPYHHVDAGDVAWSFDLPEVSLDTGDIHELTPGRVEWSFDLPQATFATAHELAVDSVEFSFDLPSPTTTFDPALRIDAAPVEFAFDLPEPSADYDLIHELSVGAVGWEFDLAAPVLTIGVDAAPVEFSFALPIPSVDFDELHELTVGAVSWSMDTPQAGLLTFIDPPFNYQAFELHGQVRSTNNNDTLLWVVTRDDRTMWAGYRPRRGGNTRVVSQTITDDGITRGRAFRLPFAASMADIAAGHLYVRRSNDVWRAPLDSDLTDTDSYERLTERNVFQLGSADLRLQFGGFSVDDTGSFLYFFYYHRIRDIRYVQAVNLTTGRLGNRLEVDRLSNQPSPGTLRVVDDRIILFTGTGGLPDRTNLTEYRLSSPGVFGPTATRRYISSNVGIQWYSTVAGGYLYVFIQNGTAQRTRVGAVNLGVAANDVEWEIDTPQAGITFIKPLDVSPTLFSFDLPVGGLAYGLRRDAAPVTFAFNLPTPSVDFDEFHLLTPGESAWTFDLPQVTVFLLEPDRFYSQNFPPPPTYSQEFPPEPTYTQGGVNDPQYSSAFPDPPRYASAPSDLVP